MTYSGLTIETTVHDSSLSSHAIPAYPEYDSTTVFDAAFYAERRAENDALIGAAVDYQVDASNPGGAVDWTDAAISGSATVAIGSDEPFTLTGTNSANYVSDYQIMWTVPAGQATIWGYTSDTSDILSVTATGYQAGSGVVTCTLVDRDNPSNSKTVTKAITVS